jgi:nitrogen regulatory protein P-II 1
LLPLDDEERHHSPDLGDEVVNEYKLELLCEDNEAEELVQTICRTAHTGLSHSGLVIVSAPAQTLAIPGLLDASQPNSRN